MKRLLIPVFAVLLVGCESTPESKNAASAEEPVYRTGSNIPVRDTEPTPPAKRMHHPSSVTQMGTGAPGLGPRTSP